MTTVNRPLAQEARYGRGPFSSLARGDYIEVYALQNTGGNLAVKAFGGYSPDFWAMRLGV